MSKAPAGGATPPLSPLGIYVRLVGMVLLWGASWPAGRIVAQSMPSVTAAAARFVLAALVLLLWLRAARGLGHVRAWDRRRWAAMALAASAGVFGYAICFLTGLQFIEAGRASMLITLSPVLTLAAAAWLFGERLNAPIVAGMAAAVVGVSLVISHGQPLALLAGAGLGRGEALIIGCVLCWVTYTLLGRRLLVGVDGLTTLAITAALGAVLLVAASLAIDGAAGWQRLWTAPFAAWAALVFLALVGTVLAYAWFFEAMAALGAGAVAGWTTLVPVAGVALSALWLGEMPGGWMLAGGALAVAGTLVMHWGRGR